MHFWARHKSLSLLILLSGVAIIFFGMLYLQKTAIITPDNQGAAAGNASSGDVVLDGGITSPSTPPPGTDNGKPPEDAPSAGENPATTTPSVPNTGGTATSTPPAPTLPPAPTPTLSAGSVPVLLYHGEGDRDGNISPALFEEHMRTLKNAGWHTITMEQFRGFMKDGRSLPDKSFLLTFDDGRKDSYYPADPVLQKYGFTAVMFVITEFSLPKGAASSTFYLSQAELKKMVDSGRWELESHGDQDHRVYQVPSSLTSTSTISGHFMSNKFWLADKKRIETDAEYLSRIKNDLSVSKKKLEYTFDKKVIGYAYPFNDFAQNGSNYPGARASIASVVPTIYTFAFYQSWPGEGDNQNFADPSLSQIRRIEPGTNWTGQTLLDALEAGNAKSLPYSGTYFGKEWMTTWGDVRPSGNNMTVRALKNTSGATALLNGSGWWKNYSYTAYVKPEKNTSVSLIGRHRDTVNYVACTWTGDSIIIEKHEGSHTSTVAQSPFKMPQSNEAVPLTIHAKGNRIECEYQGKVLAWHETNSPLLQKGGIGLQAWSKAAGVAGLTVEKITVTAN